MKAKTNKNRFLLAAVATAKLALAGAVIFAIAFAFLTMANPKGEVAEAEADILWVFKNDRTKTDKFMRTLQREGMSPPRQFDHNGNQVFFSHATTTETPREVMLRFQEAFVRDGVNTYFHDTAREAVEPHLVGDLDTVGQGLMGAEEFFSGGLIPVLDTRNEIAMIGVDTPNRAENFVEALLDTNAGQVMPPDAMRAFRYLDATREEGSLETTITAVWSDDYFDMRKHVPGSRIGSTGTVHPIETLIPACQGCVRVGRLSGTGRESNLNSLLYRSTQPVNSVLSFYDNQMSRRGWETDESTRGLLELQRRDFAPQDAAQFRNFIKDGVQATLIVYQDWDDGYTYAMFQTN